MTDTRDQIATLRALLPEIEGGEGSLADETLGRLICALHGVPISAYWTQNGSFWVETSDRKRFCDGLVWHSFTNHRPDTNLQAADDLVGEVLPEWELTVGRCSPAHGYTAELRKYKQHGTIWALMSMQDGRNFHSKCRAILAALVRARIAELEAKDV